MSSADLSDFFFGKRKVFRVDYFLLLEFLILSARESGDARRTPWTFPSSAFGLKVTLRLRV